MARLLYSAIASLDGYTVDTSGSFDWAAPSEEVHAFVNDRERTVGTYVYGRRMWEAMRYWAGDDTESDRSSVSAEAFQAGLVDEVSLYLHPISVGGGTPALPHHLTVRLQLAEQHTFGDGVVFLRYLVDRP